MNTISNSQSTLNTISERFYLLSKSIHLNYLFIFSSTLLIVALSIVCPSQKNCNMLSNIITGFLSFFVAMFFGYYVHYACHKWNSTYVYNRFSQKSLVKQIIPSFIHRIFEVLNWFNDFHDKIHHDTSINRTWKNLCIEFGMNIYVEGLYLILLNKLLGLRIAFHSYTCRFNNAIFLAWGLLYATTHIINYNIITPTCHIQHHLKNNTNYGVDYVDIILGTKYDETIENMNHASINILCIMIFILLLRDNSVIHWLIK